MKPNRPHPSSGRLIPLSACLLIFSGLQGCITEVNASAPERERRQVSRPSRPSGIEPQQMLLTAGIPSDADGNGFPDTVPVTVYLWGDTRRYQLPIAERGEFSFEIATQDGQEIGRWVFPEAEAERARGDSAAGVCYRFALRLSQDRDRIRTVPAGLRAIFTNAKTGQQVVSSGAAAIRLGAGE